MLVFITFTKNSWQQGKWGGGWRDEEWNSPHLSTFIFDSHLPSCTAKPYKLFFFFYNTLRQCVGSASVLLCLLWQDKNSLIFIKFSLILLLFLQAILKRITAKEPHYNHLQWVKKSNSVVPSFFYSCNHVK